MSYKLTPEILPLGMTQGVNGWHLGGVEWPLFGFVLGGSQRGKTEYMLEAFLHQVLVRGEGGIFFDPTYRGVVKAMRFLTAPGVRERVRRITVDPQYPQISYNPLSMAGHSEEDIPYKLDAFVDLFTVLQGWDGKQNQRAINVTHQAVEALLYLGLRLQDPELQPTIFTIPTLLTNPVWRGHVLDTVPQRLRSWWENEFKEIGKEGTPPVTHLLRLVAGSPALRGLLGASKPNFSLREAMDERLIVLAHIGEPGRKQEFLANLLLHDLVHAAFSRGDQAPELPWFLFCIDELQTVDGAAGGSVVDAFEGVAKFRVRGLGDTQNFIRLVPDTQKAMITNSRLRVVFNLELIGAKTVGQGWRQDPDPLVLTRLPDHEAIVDCELPGEGRVQFKIHTLPAEKLFSRWHNPEGVPALLELLDRQGRMPSQVSQEMETLDGRIAAALTQLVIPAEAGEESGASDEIEMPEAS